MLAHEMEVRRIGLSQFGLKNVPVGAPLSLLEAKLLPLYLHHRYQLVAAVRSVGGASYSYAVRTATGPSPAHVQEMVPAATQRAALTEVLKTITPEALDVPDSILALIPPRAFGFGSVNTELFDGRTDPIFDPLGAASIAADLAISGLLQYQRAGRLIAFHAQNPDAPDFIEVSRRLNRAVWDAPLPATMRQRAIQRTVQHLLVTRLMDLASLEQASPQVRAEATTALRNIEGLTKKVIEGLDTAGSLHRQSIREDIERFLARPDTTFKRVTPLPTPPGDPIGSRSGRGR